MLKSPNGKHIDHNLLRKFSENSVTSKNLDGHFPGTHAQPAPGAPFLEFPSCFMPLLFSKCDKLPVFSRSPTSEFSLGLYKDPNVSSWFSEINRTEELPKTANSGQILSA